MIKNLAQLKRTLVKGAEFTITWHCRPEVIGERRLVNVADTTGIYSIVPGEPENKATQANRGKGSFLGWSKAAFWKFEDGECTLYDSNTAFTPEHIIISFKVEEAAR